MKMFVCPHCGASNGVTFVGDQRGYVEAEYDGQFDFDGYNVNTVDWVQQPSVLCRNCYKLVAVTDDLEDLSEFVKEFNGNDEVQMGL